MDKDSNHYDLIKANGTQIGCPTRIKTLASCLPSKKKRTISIFN